MELGSFCCTLFAEEEEEGEWTKRGSGGEKVERGGKDGEGDGEESQHPSPSAIGFPGPAGVSQLPSPFPFLPPLSPIPFDRLPPFFLVLHVHSYLKRRGRERG